MKSLMRLGLSLLIIVLFASIPFDHVSAAANNCFGLKDADCKILAAADAKLADLTTFAYETELTVKVTFQGTANIKLKGSGQVEIDLSKVAPDATDPLSVLLPVTMSLDLTGSSTTVNGTDSKTTPLTASVILSDNVLYAKNAGATSWIGTPLSALQGTGNSSANLTASLNANPQLAEFVKDPAVLKAIASIPNIRNFIKQTKTANSPTYDNQKQAEFVTTFDFQTLIKAKEMYPVLRGLMKAGGSTTKVNDAVAAQIATALGTALKGSTLKITRWVGTTDSEYHALVVDFIINFNPAVVGVPNMKAMGFNLHFGIKLKDIGKPVSIEVPTDVQMVTPTPTP
jgi:hypothetical protein